MSTETDWAKLAFEAGTSLLSGLGGLLIGVWRWGRSSVRNDQRVKDDYTAKIESLGKELRAAMASTETASEKRLDLLVDQFKEAFAGLRRQIDDDRLHTEQNFLRKDDFREFRDEYREDMRDLKLSISEINKRK